VSSRLDSVLITGGASGLGAALARAFLDRGATVAIADPAVADGLPDGLQDALGYPVDAADPAAVQDVVDAVEGEAGPLTTVVANAGVPGGGGIEAPDEVWDQAWRVNVMAHVHLARVVVPRMLAAGGGRFVVVASAAGLLTNLGNAPYSATKHAAAALAEWLAITYGDQGLDVRLVAPMGIDTAMLRSGANTLAGESVRALGVIEPGEAAERIMAGLDGRDFLILPHPEVSRFERARVADRNSWLHGMQRAQAQLLAGLQRAGRPAAP
jgi:NAD(P)-dependent dehydrogenase (short-subunit alcohol dehydrogenase family)